jgi:hypothetical protein
MLSQDKWLPYSNCINSLNRKVSYMIVKYFTKEQLIASNENAIQANRNRSLNRDMLQDALNTIPDEAMLPVCFNMPHNDVEMRVQVAFSLMLCLAKKYQTVKYLLNLHYIKP